MPRRSIQREQKVGSIGRAGAVPRSAVRTDWPVRTSRKRMKWFPCRNRLITLVRSHADQFVLPPALVKKASWRD